MEKIKCFLIERTEKSVPHKTEHGSGDLPLYRRTDTGEEFLLNDAPVGSIYRATWYEDLIAEDGKPDRSVVGPDGQSWICVIPGNHFWLIDGRASNCDRPLDNVHNCWCRHGVAPNFTVDKNGATCNAGAGSIISPSGWHGFLRNGYLEG